MNKGHRRKYLAVLLALAFFVPAAAQEEDAKPEGDRDRPTLRERIEEKLRAAQAEPRDGGEETAEQTGGTEARGGQRESATRTGDRETTRTGDREAATRTGDRETTRAGDRDERIRRRERILRTILLPGTAEEAAESGVPEEDVEKVLKTAQEDGISPADTQVVMEGGAAAAREGEYKNFGKFVNAKLEEGLRGRELAEAIHAEKAARGKGGKGHGKDKGHSRGDRDDRDGVSDDRDDDDRDDEIDDRDDDDERGKGGKKGKKSGESGKGKGKKND